MFTRIVFFFVLSLFLKTRAFSVKAQGKSDIIVQVEAKNISTEEDLVLSVTSPVAINSQESIAYKFPEINFFTKIGVSRSKSSNYVNGQLVNSFTYSQHYKPSNPGIFKIPALEIIFNQHAVKLESFTLVVTRGIMIPEIPQDVSFGNIPKEVQNVNKPFLVVSSTNYHPFVGQGFTVKFSLFIPENNTEELNFDRNDLQIPLLIQKIKPSNCWQENFDLQEEKVLSVILNKKKYTEYRFFQSTYFALDTSPISIPSLNLRLLKSTSSGSELQKVSILFSSAALRILPKPLPYKSLSNIPVGVFELKESVSQENAKTGQKLIYKASLVGDGNSILWDIKKLESDFFIDFEQLNFSTTVFPYKDRMFGDNSQKIQIIPKQPGKFALKKYFYWVYFNTKTEKLDTLSSTIVLQVEGKPSDLKLNTENEVSEIYKGLERPNSLDLSWNRWVNWRQIVNFIIFLLFIAVGFVSWKSPK
jgi:hypothetical protein